MAIYHCSVKIGGKADGKSAVASAAYRAGEALKRTRDMTTKDFTRKGGVVHNEILLPEHAPERYRDRETLWNDVEKVEKDADAQLYREFEIALPRELTRQQQIEATREFARELNKQGMITDIALHDKGDGNPHAHIMCPTRQLDKNGEWALKEKRGYALDENGNKIPVIDPATGQQKIGARGRKMWQREKSQKNPWNDRGNVEKWRETWERVCNKALEKAGSSARIDRRSHAARGIRRLPQIHEGAAARGLERRRGGASFRVAHNNRIKAANAEAKSIGKEAGAIKGAKAAAAKIASAPMQAAQKLGKILDKGIIKTPAPPTGKPKEDNTPFSMLTKFAQQEKAADHRFDEDWGDEGESLKGNVSYIAPEEEPKKKKKDEEKEQQQQQQQQQHKKETTQQRQPEKPQEVKYAEESVKRLEAEEKAAFDKVMKAHKAGDAAAEAAAAKEYKKASSEARSELRRRLDQLEKLEEKKLEDQWREIGKQEADAAAKAEADFIKKSPLSKELAKLEKIEGDARTKFDLAQKSTARAEKGLDALIKSEPKQNVFNKLFGESAEHKAWTQRVASAEKNLAGAKKAEAAAGKEWTKASRAADGVRANINAGAKAAGAKAAAQTKGAALKSPAGMVVQAAITIIQTTITLIETCMKVMDAHNEVLREIVDVQQQTQQKVMVRSLY